MSIMELTKDNFDNVIASNGLVVVDFWAEWCAPCLAFAETYKQVAAEYPHIIFGKINTENEMELANDFNVRSIPLLMILKDNVVVFSESGTMPATALRDLIEQAIHLDMSQVKQDIAAAGEDDKS